ncbi:Bug family tripartite tricarboxylate transporter substrate binding protein [Pollutimonas harenae]|uniref:Tripartite tricarboxylate transporter substrate binding protein n=1 Tax=Pollutimonas harenae TaxID=657015 RepID=A0A853GVV3_9BURK|nr:tripartite tricarboxylate transporter substrate binding protein [Pollutimonas harenae]NYT86461.1 tripartite tricarboxylate transporter substrate binding protein [Pollutimonas harenae]TEA69792.1 tripartite tricarboxylate transporter substrate binding protein [Pollutimonas harenae]
MQLKKLLLLTAGIMAAASVHAQATWPAQPIKLVVGYSPGGPVDTSARTFAKYLSDELKQSVVVENRTGASGMIAAESVSRATPDGYTLNFVASPTLTITPIVQKKPMDHDKDFSYIGNIVDYTNVLVVNNDVPVKSVQELVEYAKKNPNAVTFGSAGVGASNHLSAELLKQKTGTEMLHVPYRGNSPAMVDVIGGKITFMFDITSTAKNYIDSGKVRALAVTSRERNAGLPDVPSMIEAGVDDYAVTGWYALIGPAELPADVVNRLHDALKSITSNADFVKNMKNGGYTIDLSDGEELKARVKREYAMWDEVIEKGNILKK